MENQPKVAVIILNWNGFNDTVECLDSLKKSDYPAYEVVLVDNGSDNREAARLKEIFPKINLIANDYNRGFAAGNNDGINWALKRGFEYIVNLNNDCIVEPDWLSRLIDGVRVSGADFASSRIMFYPEKDIICSDGDVLFPDGSAIAWNRGRKYDGVRAAKKIFSASGAASVYSRRCLEKIKIKGDQYFDGMYFAYYEDVDLGFRLNTAGFKGMSVPDAVVYHKHSRTAGPYSSFKIFHSEKNRIMNEVLNYPWYLVPVGECFFLLKLILLSVTSLFGRKTKGARYFANVPFGVMVLSLVKARVWVIKHIPRILADRRERKRKGFIKLGVIRYFSWNLGRMLR